MAGGRNSNKNKKKSKSGGNAGYKNEEQKRGQGKEKETVEKETANQSGFSGLKCVNKKKDQIEKPKPIEVTGKEENKTVDTNCHDSATENSQVKTLANELKPIEKETANQRESSGFKCVNKEKDQIEKPKPIVVTGKVENKTIDKSCNDSAKEDIQVKPLVNEIEPEKEVGIHHYSTGNTMQTDVIDNKENNEFQVDAERNEQIADVLGKVSGPRGTIIAKSVLQDHLDEESSDETVHPQEDGTDKCTQNSLRDKNIAYLRDLFKPIIIEALQNIIPSSPRNAKGLEKEPLQLVVVKSNNIKELNEQLQNKQEPNDQTQKEIKATERLENTKQPNDQCRYKQVPTEQLPNEKETFDQLQRPKEEDVQNIILSSPQNTQGLEKEALQLIAHKSNSIKELNDQPQEPKEIDPIRFEEYAHRRRSADAPKSETKTSSVEDSQIQSINGIKMETTDTTNFESTKIEESDEVKGHDDALSMDLTGNPLKEDKEVSLHHYSASNTMQTVVTDKKENNELNKGGSGTERNEQITDVLGKVSGPRGTSTAKSVQDHLDEESSDETVHAVAAVESTVEYSKDKEQDVENQTMTKVIDREVTPNIKSEPQPQEDRKDKFIQNSLKDQDIAYLRDIFRPLIIEALQNIIPSCPRNARGLEKELSQLVVDESNNIEEINKQLQNKQEPNDQTQKEIKATERLENTKEPNDQCQYKQVPTEQLPNEKETFDQLQRPKEEDVHNILLSIPQNTQGLENEALQSIADEANGIRELNDRLQEPKEIDPIKFMQEPKDGEIMYKQALQNFIQYIVPELTQVLQEKFSPRRRSSDALESETKTSSVEDSQIQLNELDVYSMLYPNNGINMETTDTPDFESTRIEEPDEVKEHYDALLIDLTENPLKEIIMAGVSNFNRNRKKYQSGGKAKYESEEQKRGQEKEKETVVEQQSREQQPFIEEEFKEEVKKNDEVVKTNDTVVKMNRSLNHVTTFGTTDGAEIKPLQEPLRFHAVHGDNIRLSKNNFRAQRKKKSNFFSKGIAFSSRPVAVGEKVSFHLKQHSSYWLGLITIGFTANDPISIAGNLPANVITERDCSDGFWAEHLDKKYYQESCRLHYYLNSSGNMCFGINGVDKIEFIWNLETTKPVWALIDIFGYFTVVEFDIPKEIRNTNFVESSLLSDRNDSGDSFNHSLDANEINKPSLNYQIRFVPLDLFTHFEASCMKFLEDRGVCVTSDDKGGYIDGKLPLFPGQIIVVQNLSVGKALFHIGVKYGSPTTEVSSELPAPVYTKVVMHMKDELAITFTEAGEIRVTKNLDVPKTILKVNRCQELWPFVEIFKRNQMIKMWSSNTPSLAAFQI